MWLRTLLLCLGSEIASAPPPTLTRLFPAGGRRGEKAVTIATGSFKGPIRVAATGCTASWLDEKGKIEIDIPADLPTDRIWVRLVNDEGASAAVPFLVGNFAEAEEKEPNNTPATAMPVGAAITVNGALANNEVDCYLVNGAVGQTLTARLAAHEPLGAPMDAILQFVAPDGHVLAQNHDDIELDPGLSYVVRKAGPIIVRLFAFPSKPDSTISYRGGNDYVYRLTITTGPWLSQPTQLAVRADQSTTPIDVIGPSGPTGRKAPIVAWEAPPWGLVNDPLPDNRALPDAWWALVLDPTLGGAGRVRVVSNDVFTGPLTPTKKTLGELTVPAAVTGRFTRPKQVDDYLLRFKKDEPMVMTVESRTFGSPVDPVLQLLDAEDRVVAENDDVGASPEPRMTFAAKEDREVRLRVYDRQPTDDPRRGYLLTVVKETADFELQLPTETVTATAGKPAEVSIKVQRRTVGKATVGPITIEAVELPDGITIVPVVSEPKGESATSVKLKIEPTADMVFNGPIRIIGRATDPNPLERTARTAEKLNARFGALWLTVQPKK